MLAHHMIRTAILLSLFAVIGTAMVAITHESTKDRIAQVERENLLRKLHAVVPADQHDNDLFADRTLVSEPKLLGSDKPHVIYRARFKGRPVGIILTPIAPDGYSGDIKLLLGLNYEGVITGVRVLDHKETPGLGDAIDERRSPWIFSFNGKSLTDPMPEKWKVQRDGGAFDQFTGATVTPRAIVKAIHKALQYYRDNRDYLYTKDKPQAAEPQQAETTETQNPNNAIQKNATPKQQDSNNE